jgi:hypothetical protein
VNCRAQEVDNLYMVDPGFFMANALRVADHVKERLS